jgi:hypothetical protein
MSGRFCATVSPGRSAPPCGARRRAGGIDRRPPGPRRSGGVHRRPGRPARCHLRADAAPRHDACHRSAGDRRRAGHPGGRRRPPGNGERSPTIAAIAVLSACDAAALSWSGPGVGQLLWTSIGSLDATLFVPATGCSCALGRRAPGRRRELVQCGGGPRTDADDRGNDQHRLSCRRTGGPALIHLLAVRRGLPDESRACQSGQGRVG